MVYVVEIRGALPTNGHTGEAPVVKRTRIAANSWWEARECAARRYGIDPLDPAMRAWPEGVAPEADDSIGIRSMSGESVDDIENGSGTHGP